MPATAETSEQFKLEQMRKEHLMLDPRPRGEMNSLVLDAMKTTSWKFWVMFALLSVVVAVCLFYVWGYLIAEGVGVAGLTRPVYWGIFLVNTVFWIGISHAGTFVSALAAGFQSGIQETLYTCCRAHDHIWIGASGIEHFHAHGAGVAFLLVISIPKRTDLVA